MLAMSKSLFSPPVPPTFASLHAKTHLSPLPQAVPYLLPKRRPSLFIARADDNGAGVVVGTAVEEKPVVKEEEIPPPVVEEKEEEPEKKPAPFASNGAAAAVAEAPKFKDPRWVAGTWDLSQFRMKSGETDWDAVIDAEARRRKWLEDNPESSSNDDPVLFNTSTIPWWAWMKRYHLPEAELLNGRAAMVGFFMAYFVDGLTGVGLVDQMGNFFCKTLLLIAVAGVLLIRKNEDVETLKKLFEETTFYDKQWQATWQDDNVSASNKEQS